MLLERVYELLIQSVLIKLVQHDLGDLRFFNGVLSQVRLEVVELIAVTLHKDQVESFIDQEMRVRSTDLGAGTVDHCGVLLRSVMVVLRRVRPEIFRAVAPLLEVAHEALETPVDYIFADPESPEAESQVKERCKVNARA